MGVILQYSKNHRSAPSFTVQCLDFIVRSHLTSKRRSVLYFPYSALFSRVKGHKGSLVLSRLLASIVGGGILWRAHFESLRAAEAKNAATIAVLSLLQVSYCHHTSRSSYKSAIVIIQASYCRHTSQLLSSYNPAIVTAIVIIQASYYHHTIQLLSQLLSSYKPAIVIIQARYCHRTSQLLSSYKPAIIIIQASYSKAPACGFRVHTCALSLL